MINWLGILATGLSAAALVSCSTTGSASRFSDHAWSEPASTGAVTVSQEVVDSQPEEGNESEALAKKLANPIASLISLPLQLNSDTDIGPDDDGDRTALNVQPVIPFTLNEDWNVISRTIVPIVSQDDVFPGAGDQFGLGDVVQSFFFSPAQSSPIWGAGPVFLIPTATEDELGTEKWGAGPTGVVLQQAGPWTYGALANHLWSFAGEDDRAEINATFVQPFLAYTTPEAWTFTLQSESTYDWRDEEWSVPIHVMATKVVHFGSQLVSIGGGLRYWADSPDSGPEGLGLRVMVTFLFPR